jgi:hypothetical protein
MTDFSNLTIARRAELAAQGWRFADGIPCADGGYYAAHDGGGYRAAVTPTPTPCILVEKGTAGYHATVAWRDQ